jgi:hypothetical protein
MFNLGSAASLADKTLVSTFLANLELLPGASGDPRAMQWWETQPEAWAACRHTHNALEDASEQGALFCKMLSETLGEMST